MAARMGRPLFTVSCHDDLTAADLTGRYLLKGGETVWVDGPLTRAMREGGICYLDEVVEARKDVTVVLHPLTDDRRILPLERTGETLQAPPEFMLVVSYNPGYQHVLKSLKPSTRQRFVALSFDFPPAELEVEIVASESGLSRDRCLPLVNLANRLRALKGIDLEEVVSTRLLVYCATLMGEGMDDGPILVQEDYDIGEEDYALDVIHKIVEAIGAGLDKLLPKMKEGNIIFTEQDHSRASYLGKRNPEDGLIDWSDHASNIYRLIRAVSKPLPGAYTYYNGQKVIIEKAVPENELRITGVTGSILRTENEKGVLVQTGSGLLWLTKVSGI
jgi:hypothetical protein